MIANACDSQNQISQTLDSSTDNNVPPAQIIPISMEGELSSVESESGSMPHPKPKNTRIQIADQTTLLGFQQTGFQPVKDISPTKGEFGQKKPFQDGLQQESFQQTGFQPFQGQTTTMSAEKFNEIEVAIRAAQEALNTASSLISEVAFVPQKSAAFE